MTDPLLGATLTDGGGNRTFGAAMGVGLGAPALAVDGNNATGTATGSFAASGLQTAYLVADLGAPTAIDGFQVIGDWECAQLPAWAIDRSTDGSTWVRVGTSLIADIPSGVSDITLDAGTLTYRYWRLAYEINASGFFCGATVMSWTGVPGVPGAEPPDLPPDVIYPSPPARAILEIYVRDQTENAPRWGIALWGSDYSWSVAGWVDVTPEGVSAVVQWGTNRPDAGILAESSAGTWTVRTYDPARKLDPSNPSSPYAPDIIPGLPVRLSHNGHIIRTGILERASFTFSDTTGELRVTDDVARLAGAEVPEATILPGTLRARARAAIAAAGLEVQVEPNPPGADPPLSDAPSGTFSAWEVIKRAALEVRYIPWVDEDRILRFARYAWPLDRGATIDSDRLVELEASISDESLYSVIRVEDPDDGPIERRITPPPRYGERVLTVNGTIIDAAGWADTVLTDRGDASLRYVLGRIYLDTADDVDEMIRRELNEIVTVHVAQTDPVVVTRARILGVRVRVEHRNINDTPTWEWYFQTTTAAALPLVSDDDELSTLIADGTGEPLYPDGVVTLT